MAKEVRLDLGDATVSRVRKLFPRLEIRHDGEGDYILTTPEIADLVEGAIRSGQGRGETPLQERLDAPPAQDGRLLGLQHRYSHALAGLVFGIMLTGEVIIPILSNGVFAVGRGGFEGYIESTTAVRNSQVTAGVIVPLLTTIAGYAMGYFRELSDRLR